VKERARMLEREEPDALASIAIAEDDYGIVENQLKKQRLLKQKQLAKEDFLKTIMAQGKLNSSSLVYLHVFD
jgi:peptidoglycan hydrolase CwlO-like protein